jgi:NAD(P)H-hydrate epimerase
MMEAGWTDDGIRGNALDNALHAADVVVVGPGLAVTPLGRAVVDKVLESNKPMVLDAGALSILAPIGADVLGAGTRIITPHPGEAARILEITPTEVQADRFAAVEELTDRVGGIVVLKGASTLVASEDFGVSVNTTGNAGMATAGTGDVLAGMCAAFLVRDSEPFEAVRLAVHVHGLAGDYAASSIGLDALIASDLIDALPVVLTVADDS